MKVNAILAIISAFGAASVLAGNLPGTSCDKLGGKSCERGDHYVLRCEIINGHQRWHRTAHCGSDQHCKKAACVHNHHARFAAAEPIPIAEAEAEAEADAFAEPEAEAQPEAEAEAEAEAEPEALAEPDPVLPGTHCDIVGRKKCARGRNHVVRCEIINGEQRWHETQRCGSDQHCFSGECKHNHKRSLLFDA